MSNVIVSQEAYDAMQEKIKRLESIENNQSVLIDAGELEDLVNDAKFLNALYAAGVDNWEGYSEAQELLEEG